MILIIGDKPSPKMKPNAKAFEGSVCAARLYRWITKIIDDPYENPPQVVNSVDNRFSAHVMLARVFKVPVVVLGNNAETALKKFLEANDITDLNWFKLPHPSYKNRKLNDRVYEARVLRDCRKWIQSQIA